MTCLELRIEKIRCKNIGLYNNPINSQFAIDFMFLPEAELVQVEQALVSEVLLEPVLGEKAAVPVLVAAVEEKQVAVRRVSTAVSGRRMFS
jgi:hypothetical protein